ncbi:MAG: hypothetical protein NZ561_04095, partial [Phycisphaerae bacterium]|nr:hypothetical protein [Phycisphaerae bacterium]
MMLSNRPFTRRRGAAAVLAMMFLTIFVTLALAMYTQATLNVQSAHNLSDLDRARAAAESGLRWMQYRFVKMDRPKTTVGNITASHAAALWPTLVSRIQSDFQNLNTPAERVLTVNGNTIDSAAIRVDDSNATFRLRIQQHPLYPGDPLDQRYLRVTSTGTYRNSTRSVSMDFKIDKKVKFAVVGKVPIQIGRNTIVEGPVAMATASKFPPLLQLTDFRHLDATLTSRIDQWHAFLKAHHIGYDNRVSINDPVEYPLAVANGFNDHNADGYVDDYDLFLHRFDANGDQAISLAEFTNPATGQLYDANLFTAIDSLGGPLYAGEPLRAGYQDGIIDNRDAYDKVEGQIVIAATADAWTANLASQGKVIQDMVQGPINPLNPYLTPVRFG